MTANPEPASDDDTEDGYCPWCHRHYRTGERQLTFDELADDDGWLEVSDA